MKKIIFILACCLIIACQRQREPDCQLFKVGQKDLSRTITSYAVAEPENKVEIVAPVSGRVEKILIKEGADVKRGQILAQISSFDRAALLDAARGANKKELAYWQKVYNPTPITAPVPGKIISVNVVPGQTVNESKALFELSDRLIFRANVDETDIAQVKIGMLAKVVVDAFSEKEFKAKVGLVRLQAKEINNVNTYQVELMPTQIIDGLLSGMTANVTFVVATKKNSLFLPLTATAGKSQQVVSLKVQKIDGSTLLKEVKLGASFNQEVEVASGLQLDEVVCLVKADKTKDKPKRKKPFFFGR